MHRGDDLDHLTTICWLGKNFEATETFQLDFNMITEEPFDNNLLSDLLTLLLLIIYKRSLNLFEESIQLLDIGLRRWNILGFLVAVGKR